MLAFRKWGIFEGARLGLGWAGVWVVGVCALRLRVEGLGLKVLAKNRTLENGGACFDPEHRQSLIEGDVSTGLATNGQRHLKGCGGMLDSGLSCGRYSHNKSIIQNSFPQGLGMNQGPLRQAARFAG